MKKLLDEKSANPGSPPADSMAKVSLDNLDERDIERVFIAKKPQNGAESGETIDGPGNSTMRWR